MNFSDKLKDEEFMNLPETEDDVPLEEESELAVLANELKGFANEINSIGEANMHKYAKRKVDEFCYMNRLLIDEGYDDKEERERIISIIFK